MSVIYCSFAVSGGGSASVNEETRQKRGPKPRNATGAAKTRLQKWLDAEGFTSAQLEAVTGISRQTMTKIRAGSDVRWKTMVRILRGVRTLSQRNVGMDEVFDLDPQT
jgi:hypothetical protein